MIEQLTTQDFQSETWRKLRKLLEQRLQATRELNDEPRSETETSALRGQIAELRFLLDLPQHVKRAAERPAPIESGDISALY